MNLNVNISPNLLVCHADFYSDGMCFKYSYFYRNKSFFLSRHFLREIEAQIWSDEMKSCVVGLACTSSFVSGIPQASLLQRSSSSRLSTSVELAFQLSGTSNTKGGKRKQLVCTNSMNQQSLVSAPAVRAFVSTSTKKSSFLKSKLNLQKNEDSNWVLSSEERQVKDFLVKNFTFRPKLSESPKYIPPKPWLNDFSKQLGIQHGTLFTRNQSELYVDFVHKQLLKIPEYRNLNPTASPLESLQGINFPGNFEKENFNGAQKQKLQASLIAGFQSMPDDANVSKLNSLFPQVFQFLEDQFFGRLTPQEIQSTRLILRKVCFSINSRDLPILKSYNPAQRRFAVYFYFLKKLQQKIFQVPFCPVSQQHQAHNLANSFFGLNSLVNKVLLHELAHAVLHEIEALLSPNTAPPDFANSLFSAGMKTILEFQKAVEENAEYERASIMIAQKGKKLARAYLSINWKKANQIPEAFKCLNQAINSREKNKYFRACNRELITCMASDIGAKAGGAAIAGIAFHLGYANDPTSLAFYQSLGSFVGADMLNQAALKQYEEKFSN